ncbi:MAG: S9 family peptidase [Sphingomonadaceae bacterium]
MITLRLLAVALAIAAQPVLAQGAPPSAPAASAQAAQPTKRPARIATAAFTEASMIQNMRLSPDGKLIALRAKSEDGKVNLAILDAANRSTVAKMAMPEKLELQWYRWAGNQRLLISMSFMGSAFETEVRFSRLLVYDIKTKSMSLVGRSGSGIDGDDLVFVDPNGEYVLLSFQRDVFEYPGVWRFPLDGTAEKQGRMIEKPRHGVWDWYADSDGTVRMAFEYLDSGGLKIWYRATAGAEMKSIAKLKKDSEEDDLWDVMRIVSGSDEGYVLKPDDSGKVVLKKFNYATRTVGETVFSAPDNWDISDVSFGDDNKPSAIFYTDDHDRVVWLDPRMKSNQARFDRALKGNEVWVTSQARDNSRMILWAGNENDPGAWYIYDAAGGKLELFFAEKPRLVPEDMPKPRPVDFQARDGSKIHGYLTLPLGRDPHGLPLIILPHGGPYGVRDKLDFDSEVQFLANRGYAVLQPNYRGSGGYGDAFEELGRGEIGRKMQDDLDDAMDWAVAQGYADPKRVCVVGSSYGGYAALWAVTRNPERYRCAASFAGVTDFKAQLRYDGKYFDRESGRKWRRRVQGEDKFDLDLVSPAAQVGRLTRPVLLAHGEDDTNVPFKQFKLMRDAAASKGKKLELLTFPDEGHGFSKPEDEAKWLDTLEAFLARHNPAD